mgnify:CR=1 FL=1
MALRRPVAMPSAGTAVDGHKLIFQVQTLSPGGPPALAPPAGGNAVRWHGRLRPSTATSCEFAILVIFLIVAMVEKLWC